MRHPMGIVLSGFIVLLSISGVVRGDGWTVKRLTATAGDSTNPKIAVDGSYVYAVWEDDTPGNSEIYFRKSTDGGATWKPVRRLTTNAGASISPSIAVDGFLVYVVWVDATPGVAQVFFLKSEDGGDHWQAARALTNNGVVSAGRPAIAVDGRKLYVVWNNDDAAGCGSCCVLIRRSLDGGVSWKANRVLSSVSVRMNDRNPAIAATDGTVYVVWEARTAGASGVFGRRSTNAGGVWKPAIRLDTAKGTALTPAVAVLGRSVYAAWCETGAHGAEIRIRRSLNHGESWRPELGVSGTSGVSQAPVLAVDDEGLRVFWSGGAAGNMEVYGRTSTDEGASWQAAERVTETAGASLFPSAAAGGAGVFAAWQEPTPRRNEIYFAAKEQAAPGISVTLPNATSVWVRGATETVKWRTVDGTSFFGADGASGENLLGIKNVKIDLYKGSDLKTAICAATSAAAGAFSWKVPTSLANGTDYKVRVLSADDAKLYGESPAFVITTGTLPDLVVDSLTANPAGPTTADTITVTAVVRNIGAAAAGASTLRLRVGAADTDHGIPALASGATATVTRTVGPLAAATYALLGWADDDKALEESDETNNFWTGSFAVTALSDLIIQSLTYTPAAPTMATPITVTIVVKNQGGGPAAASTMRFYYHDENYLYSSIPALAPGATETVIQFMGLMPSFSSSFIAWADYTNAVAESDESNNSKSTSITVAPLPDLVVSLVGEKVFIAPFWAYRLSATVTNNGPAAAGAFKVRIENSPAGSYKALDVGSLGWGDSTTVVWLVYWTSVPAGSSTWWATADYYGAISEWNEGNNRSNYVYLTKD